MYKLFKPWFMICLDNSDESRGEYWLCSFSGKPGRSILFFFLKMVPVVEGNLRATNERSSDASEKFV